MTRIKCMAMGLVAMLLSLLFIPAADADLLERIAESGVIRAGTRADTAPFASIGPAGHFEGFSVDLIEEIRLAVEKRVGRPIRTELSAVTPADRLQKIANGELDIICEITTPTWEREKLVDFSVPFFRDGTRILTFRDTVKKFPDMKDMQIAIAQGTTTAEIVERAMPGTETRAYPTMDAAFMAMMQGEVEGVANIGVVLLGLARDQEINRSMVLLPRTESLGNESMACALPQNDSEWRDFVNATIIGLFQGLSDYRGRYMEIYDKRFGRDGLLVYPLDRSTRDYLLSSDIWAQ